jgi:hypothetical protein
MIKYVGHGDQFHWPGINGKRIHRRATATSTATDESDLNCIILRGMNMREGDAGES